MKLKAKVIPSGNATAVEVPKAAVQGLEGGARPPIAVKINGHMWRTRIALMRGKCLVGMSAANRAACNIAVGDTVAVELVLDTAPRVVKAPADLVRALRNDARVLGAFEKLPFGLKRREVAAIEDAKTAEVRLRRIARLMSKLGRGLS